MESDERFKHLAKDPRFRTLRKKQRKVQIDDRFKSMFTDDKFTIKYTKDKRGWRQNKTSADDLRKFYSLNDEDVTDRSVAKTSEKLDETEQRDDKTTLDKSIVSEEDDDQPIESHSETDLSSSSDESESDAESIVDGDIDNIKFDWQPLDHDAETAETTSKRLAIQNLDWDHLDVRDIYTLVNSIRPPVSVKIYLSEFGRDRLREEEIGGPKELIETSREDEEEKEYRLLKEKMDALNSVGPKVYKINEYEDADEEMDPKNEELREKVRKYQLNRMKYYYAVVEFDSIESAELVYKELDGMEYEGSSLELDLRFIPDDIEFDQEAIKAECNDLPDLSSYKAPLFINSALQQTTVKFTWDQTDIKRQEKLNKAYTKEELEKDDLDAYLASGTDSEDEETGDFMNFNDTVSVVTANSEARVNKYKMLLKSIEEEEEKKKKVEVDVEWGNFSEEEREVEADIEKEMEENDASDEEALESRHKHGKKKHESVKSKVPKTKKQKNKRKGREVDNEDKERGDELDLLVMDADGVQREEFEFDPDDARFKAVYESGLYNIDPSHPNFKRTKAFDMIAEKKREKRHKTRS